MLIYKKAHHRKRRIRHVSQNYAHSLLQRECRMASGMCDSLLWRHNEHKASLITSLTIVYSTVYSDANHRKHHSPASLAFVRGIHRRPVNSPHKWPVTRKMFPFDAVIMLTVVDMKPSSNASRMRFLAKSQTPGRSWLDHTHIVSKQIEIALVSWLKYSFFFNFGDCIFFNIMMCFTVSMNFVGTKHWAIYAPWWRCKLRWSLKRKGCHVDKFVVTVSRSCHFEKFYQWWQIINVTKCFRSLFGEFHYSYVVMGAMASQFTSPTIVYSTVYSDADQRKHQSSASLAFVRGIHRWPVNSPHRWPVTRMMCPFDDVIMWWVFFMFGDGVFFQPPSLFHSFNESGWDVPFGGTHLWCCCHDCGRTLYHRDVTVWIRIVMSHNAWMWHKYSKQKHKYPEEWMIKPQQKFPPNDMYILRGVL